MLFKIFFPYRLTENDQFTLLLINCELMGSILLADVSRPNISFDDQLSILLYGSSRLKSIANYSDNIPALNILEKTKKSEAMSKWRAFETLQELGNLNLDNTTTILIQIICLFLVPSRHVDNPKRIKRLQNNYRLLMYRYLIRKLGKKSALQTVNSIEKTLNMLVRLCFN